VGLHLCHGPVKEGGVEEPTATNPELPLLRGDEQAACLFAFNLHQQTHFGIDVSFYLDRISPKSTNAPHNFVTPKILINTHLNYPASIVNMADHEAQIVEFAGLSGASPEEVRISPTHTK
jgi:hypothetical protein